ncbi:hypothetical protein E1301_Tti007670 [Triplophysa tibetana]|uniref:LRRCT domain-containing protein n=1 Tax=Triplophysa tibetana TaxID=1572043 RepID=A0A5A9PB63_9TELE|nr:hypothetical protein E1301_Tti007670 [Triplophysa tibetana]
MVTVTQVKLTLVCPSTCVVCSEDVTICHKLLKIIDAPDTTRALMLTDGLINSVDNIALSDLSNMSVLALSNNAISTIMENAFRNLTFLTTLSLDHNHISSQSLDNSTFSQLQRLDILQLGNNDLKYIDGSWFQNSRALKTLQLEGNLLTSLNSSIFIQSDLRNLETLDLSDNLIMYLDQNSFRGLPRLRSLDLSRNYLQNSPDAFSYLSWLSMLNLDFNRWSCNCELRELASFLNSYIQAPDKVLYNGQRMVCVNTDNPAVQNVLELTEANCVPPNQNITVKVVAKCNISPQQYVHDVAIAIVFSFLGGVCVTLGIIATVYHKLSMKSTLVQEENKTEEGEMSSPELTQWKFSEGKDTLSMSHALYNRNYKSHQPQDGEDSTYRMGPEPLEDLFTCHKCTSTALAVRKQRREIVLQRTNHMEEQHERDDDWPACVASHQSKGNDRHSVLQQRIKDKSIQRQIERQPGIPSTHNLGNQDTSSQLRGGSNDISAVRIQQLALNNHFSAQHRGPFRLTDQVHNNSLIKRQALDVGPQPVYRTTSCLHCHQTYEYKQAGSNTQIFPFQNHRHQHGEKLYDTMLYRDILGYNSNVGECGESQASELSFKLASHRSVSFDLSGSEDCVLTTPADRPKGESRRKSSKTSAEKRDRKSVKTKSSTHGHLKPHKSRTKAKKTLKVKLNLNPLRKNRVHPKSGGQEVNEEDEKMFKKAKKEKLRGKKDLEHKAKNEKPIKKSKKNTDGSEDEEEEDPADQDTSTLMKHAKKAKHSTKKKKISKSNSKDFVDVAKESFHNVDNSENVVPVEGETLLTDSLLESLVSSTLQSSMPLTLNTEDVTNTQQLNKPGLTLSVSALDESTAQQYTVDQTSSLDLTSAAPVIQEYVSSAEGSPKRKIRLIIPEKTSNRPPTALDKKIR